MHSSAGVQKKYATGSVDGVFVTGLEHCILKWMLSSLFHVWARLRNQRFQSNLSLIITSISNSTVVKMSQWVDPESAHQAPPPTYDQNPKFHDTNQNQQFNFNHSDPYQPEPHVPDNNNTASTSYYSGGKVRNGDSGGDDVGLGFCAGCLCAACCCGCVVMWERNEVDWGEGLEKNRASWRADMELGHGRENNWRRGLGVHVHASISEH